ncbi:bystin-like [Paramacrobiotus metropolitanus]|uniref:bystin-like n=1 Tax=Paramacrobiotus metropolitanus TaxID=2943436 RepID=UPI002445CB4C|nr:bystin-like [Paramacrobiotus metropolitanus]
MGKIKRLKLSKQQRTKDQSLTHQIIQDETAKPTTRTKERKRHDVHEKYVESNLSEKILRQAREQQEELEETVGLEPAPKTSSAIFKPSTAGKAGSDAEGDIYEDQEEPGEDANEFYEPINISEEDEQALEMFMTKDAPARKSLQEILRGRLSEKKTELETAVSEPASLIVQKLHPELIELYQGVRDVLKKYRSGKLPKAFKVIPKMPNWEQVLYVTEPENWSAAAMFQATRLFASNLKDRLAQRFYFLVLLPRIRDDIAEYKRLNFHLYQALRKSLFKPGAFFKGFLLPLCESGTCTLREAVIVSSVMAKNSIPMLHSAAAIMKIAEMNYTGANSVFLRTLLDKKYALPCPVIDATVYHFIRFMSEKRKLPVLWHQSLLTFVQRYKEDLASEQKEGLIELTSHQYHYQLSPEIRRELINAKSRDIEQAIPMEE